MTEIYKHTQIGFASLALLGFGILIILGAILTAGSHPILIAVCVLLLACVITFPAMTIEVNSRDVAWRFGPGLIHKTIQLTDIESAQVVKNRLIYSWGIRSTPHGWLYSVSGLAAVEIQLMSGKRIRLGSDEPEKLGRAIHTAKAI
jgi:hypothetical protein